MNIPCSFSWNVTCSFLATGERKIRVQMIRWRTKRRILPTSRTLRTGYERQRFCNANIAQCPLTESKLSTTRTAPTRRYFACQRTILWDSTAKKLSNPSILSVQNKNNQSCNFSSQGFSPPESFHQFVSFIHCFIFNYITLWLADTLWHSWCNFRGALNLSVDSIQSHTGAFVKIRSSTSKLCSKKMLTRYLEISPRAVKLW